MESVHVVPPPDRWTVLVTASFWEVGSIFELLAAGTVGIAVGRVVMPEPGPLSFVR